MTGPGQSEALAFNNLQRAKNGTDYTRTLDALLPVICGIFPIRGILTTFKYRFSATILPRY